MELEDSGGVPWIIFTASNPTLVVTIISRKQIEQSNLIIPFLQHDKHAKIRMPANETAMIHRDLPRTEKI